ncbi:hypothetical protein R3P38DRAFT_2935525, partial [Favolaschia claudopus]
MADARSRPPPQEGKVRIQMEFGEIKQMFDMKANRPFSQPMHMFAKKIQREMSFLRFNYNGTRIQETDTANSVYSTRGGRVGQDEPVHH